MVWGENSNYEIGKYTLSLPQDGNNIEVWKVDNKASNCVMGTVWRFVGFMRVAAGNNVMYLVYIN